MKVGARQDLPEIEVEATLADDAPATGVATRREDRRLPWGWIAAGAVALVLVLLVSGLGGHAEDSADGGHDDVPPATNPGPVVSRAALSAAGVSTTIEMRRVDRGTGRWAVRFDYSGTGGVPGRTYWLRIGVCPSLDAVAGASSAAQSDTTFAASLETPVLPGAPLWIDVRDGQGTSVGTAQGRLLRADFTPLPPGVPPCGGVAADSGAREVPSVAYHAPRKPEVGPEVGPEGAGGGVRAWADAASGR